MILLGDDLVPYENINLINSIEDISNTASNCTLLFSVDYDLMKYCFENQLPYAVKIASIKDAVYANALNAKYIICKEKLDIDVQKIAEDYMFDSKILAILKSSDDIEAIAQNGIDGAIYERLLEK